MALLIEIKESEGSWRPARKDSVVRLNDMKGCFQRNNGASKEIQTFSGF